MVRNPCCEKMGLKKGSWTPEEDRILISYIQRYGHDNWRALPKQSGLQRCGKSCRLRWTNYLRPDIKRGNFSREEEEVIMKLHGLLGNRWSAIAAKLPGRTDNEIKNFWHTHLKKRLRQSVGTPCTLNTDTQNFGHEAILPQQSQISASHPSMAPMMHLIGAQGKGSLPTVSATDCSLLSRNISATRKYSLLVDEGLPSQLSPDSTTSSTNSSKINDERGFWYDLFIKAGESSQPPLNLE